MTMASTAEATRTSSKVKAATGGVVRGLVRRLAVAKEVLIFGPSES
jgi:hypothetical protein